MVSFSNLNRLKDHFLIYEKSWNLEIQIQIFIFKFMTYVIKRKKHKNENEVNYVVTNLLLTDFVICTSTNKILNVYLPRYYTSFTVGTTCTNLIRRTKVLKVSLSNRIHTKIKWSAKFLFLRIIQIEFYFNKLKRIKIFGKRLEIKLYGLEKCELGVLLYRFSSVFLEWLHVLTWINVDH